MQFETLNTIIGKIYDCAIEPDGWPETLRLIASELDFAYVALNYFDASNRPPDAPPDMISFTSPWDETWMARLQPLLPTIPGYARMIATELDVGSTQMQQVDEDSFRSSDFYHEWVRPQGLLDACNMPFLRREKQFAMTTATTYEGRDLIGESDVAALQLLSPHIRRSMLISNLLEETRSKVDIYHRLLDRMSAAVFLVDAHGRIVHQNAAAEDLLTTGLGVGAVAGKLRPLSAAHREAFVTAIARACSGTDSDIGCWGNGMALPSAESSPAVAYVLPLGRSEQRRALGPGLAAVFVTTRQSSCPPPIEVLSALSGMTAMEARIALAVADGQSTEAASQQLGMSIHTLRRHLANIYDKTGLRSQVALGAFVNKLGLPVRA